MKNSKRTQSLLSVLKPGTVLQRRTKSLGYGISCLAMCLLVAGCLSTHPGSSSLAYVAIEGASMDAIDQATRRVFRDEGYHVESEQQGIIVFEREATQGDRLRWGNYVNKDLRMRVVVSFEPMEKGGILVRADAYVQRIHTMEKLRAIAKRPYQHLLNRVRDSLEERSTR